ncbi:hypothetical protein ACFQ07_04120, partial [Actinomadura adrarensis]
MARNRPYPAAEYAGGAYGGDPYAHPYAGDQFQGQDPYADERFWRKRRRWPRVLLALFVIA